MLKAVLKNNRVVGVVGNRNTGKSSLILSELIKLKKCKSMIFPIYVFGVEEKLKPYLEENGIKYLYNKEDIFDLKIKNAVIFIDEISNFVSTSRKSNQTARFKRFINRIAHNNCWFIMGTAEVGFWNKLACSVINAFIVKEVELDSLTNGTWLKRLVLGLERTSDYRVDMPINTYFMLENDNLTSKHTYKYNKNLDSKSENVNPFK